MTEQMFKIHPSDPLNLKSLKMLCNSAVRRGKVKEITPAICEWARREGTEYDQIVDQALDALNS